MQFEISYVLSADAAMPGTMFLTVLYITLKEIYSTIHNPVKYQPRYLNRYNAIYSTYRRCGASVFLKFPLTENIRAKSNLLLDLFAFANLTTQ